MSNDLYLRTSQNNHLSINGLRGISFSGTGKFFNINITSISTYTDLNFVLFGRIGICAYTITGTNAAGVFYNVARQVLSYRADVTIDRIYPITLSQDKYTVSINVGVTMYDVIRIVGTCSTGTDLNTFSKEEYDT